MIQHSSPLTAIDAFLAQNSWCRILKVVLLDEGPFAGWDCIALFDKLFCDLRHVQIMRYVDIVSIDDYLERLAQDPPNVVIGMYLGTVPAEPPVGDVRSIAYRHHRGVMNAARLYRWAVSRGAPLFWDIGDPWNRITSEEFYAQVRAFGVTGLISANYGAIDLIREELARRGIKCVRSFIYKPFGINPEVHCDYGLPKTVNFTLTGRTNEAFRQTLNRYCRVLNYLSIGALGFKRVVVQTSTEYAQWVNRSRFSLAAHQSRSVINGCFVGHTVAKYFEIPGCRALLVAQKTSDMERLGFVDGENYVPMTEQNYQKVIGRLWWDRKKAYIEGITERGYRLVHDHHTNQQRVENLVREVVEAAAAIRGHQSVAR